jgi:carboxyl-terminal processing protease
MKFRRPAGALRAATSAAWPCEGAPHRSAKHGGCSISMRAAALAIVMSMSMAGCGGGGGSGSSAATPPAPEPSTQAGPQPLAASAALAGQCAAPRSGIDPDSGKAFRDRAGTLADEQSWVRSWIDETYLWYDEVPTNLKAADYATPLAYFNALKTPALTSSGRAKDRFHYTYDTARYQDILQSSESGYGVEFAYLQRTAPRDIRAAYTEPGSPAAQAGIARGATLLEIDGIDAVNASSRADVDRLNAALSPAAGGETHAFKLRALDGTIATMSLTSASIDRSPVQNVRTIETSSGRVGYLQFNDHVDKAEAQLIAAVDQFKTAGIGDLVLDMRYNGGGLLAIASELAAMIAPASATRNAAFERLSFNDKNPFGFTAAQATLPFYTTTRGYSATAGQPLPRLDLARVTVLAGPDTCSASESVVNSLRGVGVGVSLIGAGTCGKPYGFYPEENCGTTYFAIQFQGVNAQGFGDYGDGFAPTCTVADDFEHALGDPSEARLAAALSYRTSGSCPAAPMARSGQGTLQKAELQGTPYLERNPLRSNRILRSADFSN